MEAVANQTSIDRSILSPVELIDLERTQYVEAGGITNGVLEEKYGAFDAGLEGYNKTLFPDLPNAVQRKLELLVEEKNTVRLLILGAGTGKLAREIKKLEFGSKVAITEVGAGDPRTEEQKESDQKEGIIYNDANIPELELPPDSLDLVLSRATIMHLIDPLGVLKRLYSSLVIDGEMVADFSLARLEDRFFQTSREQANKDARSAILSLRSSGVDIDIGDRTTYLRRTKNEFPPLPIRYLHPLKDQNINPVYGGVYKYIGQPYIL